MAPGLPARMTKRAGQPWPPISGPLFPCFRGGSALPPYPGLPLFFSFYWGSGLEFRINDPPRSWPPPLCMLATLSWHMPHRCHLSLSSLVSGDEDTGNLDFLPGLLSTA